MSSLVIIIIIWFPGITKGNFVSCDEYWTIKFILDLQIATLLKKFLQRSCFGDYSIFTEKLVFTSPMCGIEPKR